MSKEKEKKEECDYKNNNKDDIEAGSAYGHPKYSIGEKKDAKETGE